MNSNQPINHVSDIIGKGDSLKDWRVVPSEHAALYQDKAEPLAEVLLGSRVQGLAEIFEDLDHRAVKARDKFKNTINRADWAIFSTATLATLLLIAGVLQQTLGGLEQLVVGLLGVLSIVSAGLAGMWLNQVKGGKLLNTWMQERAKAEAKRLAYFKAVIEDSKSIPFDQMLSLEYTRRYLLDHQIDYFRERGEVHNDAADKALTVSTRAVFMATSLTAIAGLVAIKFTQLTTIAGIGAICSAYATLVTSKTAINLDRRNADRYRIAEDQLKDRRLEIDHYRGKILNGDQGAEDAVQEFFEPVFVILEADHKDFLSNEEQRELAIGNMEKRLDLAKQSLNEKQK